MFVKTNKAKSILGLFLILILSGCQVSTISQPSPAPVIAPPSTTSQAVDQELTVIAESAPTLSQNMPDYTNVWQRIGAGLSLFESNPHPSVDNELQWYANNQKFIDRITERAAPFLFWIVEEIESRGLPLELALLPIIESGYNPSAYSSQHAAGLWQFMGPTAESYGLTQSWWYDGRRDPLSSTVAALDYLEMLYAEFDNDWLLALAAYNAGEGAVKSAIRRNTRANRSTEFWQLPLPGETVGHVPRLLAIAKLIANATDYGVILPVIPNEAYLEVVELNFQIDLALASNAANLEPGLLRTLNPGYLQWATHPDNPQYLVVPKSKSEEFRAAIANIPVEKRVTWDRYEIRSGDTLGGIATQFNIKVDVLQKVNNLIGSRIVAGRSLMIPRFSSLQLTSVPTTAFQGSSSFQAAPNSYRVRRGDNLWRIARKFDLHSFEIAKWNSISIDSLLHPGQVLVLTPPGFIASLDISESGMPDKVLYRIVKGDSLARIAGKFGLTVDDIVAWNNLNPKALVFPGQELELFVSRPM